jgi:S-adenosylmethionine:tRNA ribosyltransferase-isomerase
MGPDRRRDRGTAQRRARRRRPPDRRRHDPAAPANEDGSIGPFEGDTAIFITPGYRFKAVDGLVTNFHLPRSTLFMLVSALMGLDVMKSAYAYAIAENYRFYSYGDASLLLPQRPK